MQLFILSILLELNLLLFCGRKWSGVMVQEEEPRAPSPRRFHLARTHSIQISSSSRLVLFNFSVLFERRRIGPDRPTKIRDTLSWQASWERDRGGGQEGWLGAAQIKRCWGKFPGKTLTDFN